MPIPDNITKEDIIKAVNQIKAEGQIPSNRESTIYDLKYEGNNYPPKYVIYIANQIRNNQDLNSQDYTSIESRSHLKKLDFNVIKKDDAEMSYWIFQANPDVWKSVYEDLNNVNNIDWYIKQHKDDIKQGHKVIIWITGLRGGCFGLGEIASELFYVEQDEAYMANVELEYNLLGRPILNLDIKSNPIFDNFLGGNQGTNFESNIEHYEEFLKIVEQPYVWIEMSHVKDREDRKIGDRALGKMLWSPQKDKSGADRYARMRDIKPNDITLHLIDNTKFSGVSLAKSECYKDIGIEGTNWEGPAYLVDLNDYEELEEPINKNDILSEDNKNTLRYISNSSVVFYTRKLELRQGAYLTPCPRTLARLINNIYFEKTKKNMPHFDSIILEDLKGGLMTEYKESNHGLTLNTILYGPPGTGKTYNTLNYALSILENRNIQQFDKEDRDDIKQRYEEYQKNNQIEFITFHQSYSYEDFIEGIKPKLISEDVEIDEEREQIQYKIIDGVFKTLSDSAKFTKVEDVNEYIIDIDVLDNAEFYKMSLGNTLLPEDEVIYDYCLNNNVIAVGYGGDNDYSKADNENKIAKELSESLKGIREYNAYEIFAINCFKNMIQKGDIVLISKGNTKVRAIAKITGDYYYDDDSPIRYNQFREVEWLYKDVEIPVSEIYEKNLSQQTIYQFHQDLVKKDFFKPKVHKERNKNYVLIIDEINRGNIANIFGELITLIEDDKRLGKQNELKATLPYSKESFSVPDNLYIIGTMNTADRSVESLDTALRRRFSFIPMYPIPELLDDEQHKCADIDLRKMVETINQRIEKLKDLDYCIGHSYFMNIENKANPLSELKHIFNNKVIPLLQEYFYNDWEKIGLILGSEFVTENGNDTKFASNFNPIDDEDYEGFETRKIYTFTNSDNWTLDTFKSIYNESQK